EIRLGRLREELPDVLALPLRREAPCARRVSRLEARQRTLGWTCELSAAAAKCRAVHDPRVARQARLHLGLIEDLAHCPGHVHAATELIEPLRERADGLRVLLVAVEPPDVEEGDYGVEVPGLDRLGGPDVADPCRITIHRIEI